MVVHAAAVAAARGAAVAGRAAGSAARAGVRGARVARKKRQRSGRPTTDQIFTRRQYRNRYRDREGEDERDERRSRASMSPAFDAASRSMRRGVRNVWLDAPGKRGVVRRAMRAKRHAERRGWSTTWRAYGAAVTALIWCIPWFVGQLGFWFIMLMGAGIEFGALAYNDLNLSLLQQIALTLGSMFGLGKALFAIGWIVSSLVFGVPQLVVTFLAFKLWGVNPFAGQAWTMLGIALALYVAPLGFFIWSVIWMLSIIEQTRNA